MPIACKKFYTLRYIMTAIMFSLGAFYALSCLGNITDMQFNLDFVKNLLSMKGVPAHAGVVWRAVHSPALQVLAYWCVVVAELCIAITAFWGAFDMFRHCRSDDETFHRSKLIALIAIGLGIALYFFGYLVIGDQWFRAWMSKGIGEDVEGLAFRYNALFCMLFVMLRLTP